MHFLHVSAATVAWLASLASAHGTHYIRSADDGSLQVTLEAVSPSSIRATVKNAGSKAASFLSVGTILDDKLPVRKLSVVDSNGAEVPFLGIDIQIKLDALKSSDYETIAAGASVSRVIDAGFVHDFAPGTYTFVAEGMIDVEGAESVAYRSNAVSMAVFNEQPAGIRATLDKRTVIMEETCTPEKLAVVQAAAANCGALAAASAADAEDPTSERFVEYFLTNRTEDRELVAKRLRAVERECNATPAGNTKSLCKDYFDDEDYCHVPHPLVAYTTWVNGWMVFCDIWYNDYPLLPQECHRQDQVTTMIHEMTHARPLDESLVATQDLAYSYPNVTKLTGGQPLYNADTYSLYANAVYLDC